MVISWLRIVCLAPVWMIAAMYFGVHSVMDYVVMTVVIVGAMIVGSIPDEIGSITIERTD